jgi:HAE1 family hydrophobic/amphiphilic exporter-1
VSRAGQSDVILEFAWGTNMDLAGIDVREKIDLLQLPIEASRPILLRFDPSTEPVMRYAFVDSDEFAKASPTESGSVERLKSLRRFADDRLKPDLESVDGSAAVKVSGGYEDEIQVYVDQDKLAQLNLSIEMIAIRLREENVNLSGGRLEQGTQRFLVRTLNEFSSVQEMADSIIATVDGSRYTCATSRPSPAATRTAKRSPASMAANRSSSPSTRKATPTPYSWRAVSARASRNSPSRCRPARR